MGKEKTPVELAYERHINAIHSLDKEAFLDNLADDVVFEDPVGRPRLSDNEGVGLGKKGMAEMWDKANGRPESGEVRFEMDKSYVCGNEIAHVGRTRGTYPKKGGGSIEVVCEGVFTYRVNDEGKIDLARAFFDFDDAYSEADVE